jgi:hypothetical protein
MVERNAIGSNLLLVFAVNKLQIRRVGQKSQPVERGELNLAQGVLAALCLVDNITQLLLLFHHYVRLPYPRSQQFCLQKVPERPRAEIIKGGEIRELSKPGRIKIGHQRRAFDLDLTIFLLNS